MDEQAIEAKALTPLRDELNSIAAIADRRALAAWIGGSLRADVDPLNNTNFYTHRVFISYGQSWRNKYREEFARQIVLTDGHALDEYPADTVRNLDPWSTAFAIKPGQRLYLGPPDRVRVW